MAATLTRQWRKYPTSGNTRVGDGNPLHSAMTYDLVHGVNNLHYVQPFVAYVAAPTTDGTHLGIYAGPSATTAEIFAAQFPTVVPDGTIRFCWTLGFYSEGLEGRSATINNVKVYAAQDPYTQTVSFGQTPPDVVTSDSFIVGALGGVYGVSTYDTAPIAIVAATETYHFIDMSAGTLAMLPFENKLNSGTSWLNGVHLIVTFNITDGAAGFINASIRLASFTGWWLME